MMDEEVDALPATQILAEKKPFVAYYTRCSQSGAMGTLVCYGPQYQ